MARKKAAPAVWQNRIVGYSIKPASQYQAHPDNWRRHPKRQQDAVVGSLNQLGWIDVVLENVRTGHLLDGHERIYEALARGDETPVPCIQVDLDESEEPLALLTIDTTAAMAETDRAKLAELLQMAETEDAALRAMLDELAEEETALEMDTDGMPPPRAARDVTCPECGAVFEPRRA